MVRQIKRPKEQIIDLMYKIIMNYGEIKRLDLIEKLGITINNYEHLTSYFRERYGEMVKFNPETKSWEAPEVLIRIEIEKERDQTQKKLFDIKEG